MSVFSSNRPPGLRMTGLLAVCPNCGQSHETIAALQDQLTAAAKRESGLRAKLHQEMKTGPLMNEIGEVFDHWLKVCRPNGKRKPKLDAKRIGVVRARLKDDWKVDELKRSIDGHETDDWTMGREKRTKGATRLSMIERLLADSGSVEHGLSLADAKDAGEPVAPVMLTVHQPRPVDPGSGVRRVLSALEAYDLRIVPRPGGWEAQCPAHDDRTPSLGIDPGGEGALLCCQRGCTVDEICRALRLDVAALFDTWQDPVDRPLPQIMRRTNGQAPERTITMLPTEAELEAWHASLLGNEQALAVLYERKRWTLDSLGRYGIGLHKKRLIFPVRNSAGELLTVARYSPSPVNGDPKMLGLAGHGRHPFPAPESYDPQAGVWLVEGEPDVLSAHELGLPAVAVPGVEWAKGQKLTDLADRLSSRPVAVCMDCDDPGRAAATRIRAALVAAGVDVRVVDLDPDRTDGFDVGDVLKRYGPLQGGHFLVSRASGGTRSRIGDAA